MKKEYINKRVVLIVYRLRVDQCLDVDDVMCWTATCDAVKHTIRQSFIPILSGEQVFNLNNATTVVAQDKLFHVRMYVRNYVRTYLRVVGEGGRRSNPLCVQVS